MSARSVGLFPHPSASLSGRVACLTIGVHGRRRRRRLGVNDCVARRWRHHCGYRSWCLHGPLFPDGARGKSHAANSSGNNWKTFHKNLLSSCRPATAAKRPGCIDRVAAWRAKGKIVSSQASVCFQAMRLRDSRRTMPIGVEPMIGFPQPRASWPSQERFAVYKDPSNCWRSMPPRRLRDRRYE
jgi:hypothetical protein